MGRTDNSPLAAGLGALAFVALLLPSAAPAALTTPELEQLAASGRVDQEVLDRVVAEGRSRVIVTFEVTTPRHKRLRRFDTERSRRALEIAADDILRSLPRDSFELRHRYAVVNAIAGIVDAEGLLALVDAPGVSGIGFDLPGSGHLTESVPYIGATAVWDMGFDGEGVTVSVIDSGVDYKHKALKGAVNKERNNSQCICQTNGGCCPNGRARQSGKKAAQDDNGHGTHVSGIVGSRKKGGVDRGVAYQADILPIKVIADDNSFCCYSDVLAALDWIASNGRQVDVVNMSLGTNLLLKGNCDNKHPAGQATATAVKALKNRGTLVFASSGNDNDRKKMSLPACTKDVTSVAAQYDSNFASADFGNCTDGPGIAAGDAVCFSNTNSKTDLFAPGAPVDSARLGGGAVTFFGTSMASPMAAGCAALLRQAAPNASVAQILKALDKGDKITDPKNKKKIPEVDCDRALAALTGS